VVWEGRKSTLRTKKRSKKRVFLDLLDQLWTKKFKNRHTFFTFSTISGAIFGTKCFRSPFHNRGGVHTENEGRDLTFKLIRYCLDTAPPPLLWRQKKAFFRPLRVGLDQIWPFWQVWRVDFQVFEGPEGRIWPISTLGGSVWPFLRVLEGRFPGIWGFSTLGGSKFGLFEGLDGQIFDFSGFLAKSGYLPSPPYPPLPTLPSLPPSSSSPLLSSPPLPLKVLYMARGSIAHRPDDLHATGV
jgi:hypothetical protein